LLALAVLVVAARLKSAVSAAGAALGRQENRGLGKVG